MLLGVEVEGASVSRAFLALRRLLSDLRESWAQIGAEAVENTIPFVPVESGALVDSLLARAAEDQVEIVAGGGSVVYAGVQDQGWPAHNIDGSEFMEKGAVKTLEDDAADGLAHDIQTLIRRVGLD